MCVRKKMSNCNCYSFTTNQCPSSHNFFCSIPFIAVMSVDAQDVARAVSRPPTPKRPSFTRSISDTPNIHPSATGSPTPSFPPKRPPRNPARPPSSGGIASPSPVRHQPKSQSGEGSRPRTATGTREEVTPWELYPAPPDIVTAGPASQTGPSTSKRVVTVTEPKPVSLFHLSFLVPNSTRRYSVRLALYHPREAVTVLVSVLLISLYWQDANLQAASLQSPKPLLRFFTNRARRKLHLLSNFRNFVRVPSLSQMLPHDS